MSIMRKLLISISLFVILPMAVSPLITNKLFGEMLEEKINTNSRQILNQISLDVDNVINQLMHASNVLYGDTELIEMISDNSPEAVWDAYLRIQDIENRLTNITSSILFNYRTDIVLMDFEGRLYRNTTYLIKDDVQEIYKRDWFKKTLQLDGRPLWIAPSDEHLNFTDYQAGNISMSRVIKSSSKPIGVLLVSVYPDSFFSSIIDESELYTTILANETGKLIESTSGDKEFKHLDDYGISIGNEDAGSFVTDVNGEKSLVNYVRNYKTQWVSLQILPYKQLFKELDSLKYFNFIVSVIIIVILFGIIFAVIYKVTKPLVSLRESMGSFSRGDFSVRAEVVGNDEITLLSQSFNNMVEEIKNLVEHVKNVTIKSEKARLSQLQAQINPHFLLNTLNGIKWMSVMSNAPNVSKSLSALGYLLENTIGRDNSELPLEEELKCVESYVDLQKIRYGDHFDLQISIEQGMKKYQIPCLLIQPLVENAILHGMLDMKGRGIIKISAYTKNVTAFIEVEDNGVGISKEKLEIILNEENSNKGRLSSIGIKNVDERIKLIYGEEYGVSIVGGEGKGTAVTVRLPVQKEVDL